MVESLKIITREKSHRIAKFAFDYAMQNNRKKVTAIHKANIMSASTCLSSILLVKCIVFYGCRKQADGMFLECCTQVAELYPKIKFESMIVDNTCMQVLNLSKLLVCSVTIECTCMSSWWLILNNLMLWLCLICMVIL